MCLDRFRSELTLVSGLVAAAVILAVGLVFYFTGDEPARWWALCLSVNFFALFTFILGSPWPVQKPARMRLFLGGLVLNAVALLALPPHFEIYLILFFVLSVTAAASFEQNEWQWWLVGFGIITLAFFLWRERSYSGVLAALIYFAGFYFFAIFARSLTEAREAEAEIKRLYDQLQTYAQQAEDLAVMEERTRMAREMHDTVGHRLTVAAVQLEAAGKLIRQDPERAQEVVGVVREQVVQALEDLRRTVAALRSPVEEDLPLATALQRLVRTFAEAAGMTVTLTLPDDLPPDLPAVYRKALYRAAQEALTNVQKHAHASHAWMKLQSSGDEITLIVEDDGVGFGAKAGEGANGFGLQGLQERARALGGDFRLEPRQPRGSRAVFTVDVKHTQDTPSVNTDEEKHG